MLCHVAHSHTIAQCTVLFFSFVFLTISPFLYPPYSPYFLLLPHPHTKSFTTKHPPTHTHIFLFTQVLKGHDHVIESVCFGKKPAAVPLLPPPPTTASTASATSLNLMDISQKTEKTDDTSLVDIIGVIHYLMLLIVSCFVY